MSLEQYVLEIIEATDETFEITITNSDTGAPVDIDGFTFSGAVRKTATDVKLIAEPTFTIINAATGRVNAKFPNDLKFPMNQNLKAAKTPTDFSLDMKYNDGTTVTCFFQGILRVYPLGSK